MAYQDRDCFIANLKHVPEIVLKYHGNVTTHFYHARLRSSRNSDVDIIIIRGTASISDFIHDLVLYFHDAMSSFLVFRPNLSLFEYNQKLHPVEYYTSELNRYLQEAKVKRNIVFVGHSLGGALAIHMALVHNASAITFSAPGRWTRNGIVEGKILKIVPKWDLVPKIGNPCLNNIF
jgi:pimeloyl-ACP methyl ester carboxylesterase